MIRARVRGTRRVVAARESEVQITFGACGYETRVWLNGVPLRTVEREEVHVGEYTSFSFELPREHLAAVHRLMVRVALTLNSRRQDD
jgi:hypothetical protein